MSKKRIQPQQRNEAWKAFSVVMAAGFVGLLSVSIVNVALPSIEKSLHATPTQFQWIVAGYAVAFGLLLVPSGRFGDVLGRRPVFLFGSLLFMLTSLACGFSTSAGVLVVMRVLQGIGASVTTPQVIGFIQELFQGRERAHAFGIFGMVVSISSAIGPALGGALVSGLGPDWGWRSVFLVNIPFSIFILVMGPKLLPAGQKREKGSKLNLDSVGLVLMALGVLALMLPFILATDPSYGVAHAPWYFIGVGLLFGALFTSWELWRESNNHEVVMPRSLMKKPGFHPRVSSFYRLFRGMDWPFCSAHTVPTGGNWNGGLDRWPTPGSSRPHGCLWVAALCHMDGSLWPLAGFHWAHLHYGGACSHDRFGCSTA